VVVAGLGTPVLGQDSVDLKWKFEKGKAFYQTMTTKTDQDISTLGMKISQKLEQTFYFSWTPLKQNADGSWDIEQKIEGVKMDIQIGPNPITYDSTKESPATNPLSDFFKALVGSKFTLTVSADMKVIKIEGREDFLKRLTQPNQQMKGLLEAILSDEALKQMADPAFAMVPGKTVKKGESWSRQTTLNMGAIGSYLATYTYTFDGFDATNKKLAKLSVKTDVKYTKPGAGASPAGLPFKVVDADLKTTGGTGTVLFDTDKGRVASSDLSMNLSGKLTIDISGMSSDVELSQKQTTTVKTSDDNPIKKEEKPATKKEDKK
jgi:hypothetical protein